MTPASPVDRVLRPGQMAVLVTVGYADAPGGRPIAVTAALARPDMFKITAQAAPEQGGVGLGAGWSLATPGNGP